MKRNTDLRGMVEEGIGNNYVEIYVLSLLGDDGGTSHAVSIYNNMIFDSNMPFAMKYTQEALDFCCSTEEKKVKCLGVNKGICFQLRKDKRRVINAIVSSKRRK